MSRKIPAISEKENCLSANEALTFLGGISRQTLANYIAKKKLPHYRVGGRIVFLGSDLEAFVRPTAQQKPDLSHGKASDATLVKLRSQGFKV